MAVCASVLSTEGGALDKPIRKPPMEAARMILTLVCFEGSKEAWQFMDFALARADEDEHVRTIKEMVEAELPFWEVLKTMPPLEDSGSEEGSS
jgi:hypothetical protein